MWSYSYLENKVENSNIQTKVISKINYAKCITWIYSDVLLMILSNINFHPHQSYCLKKLRNILLILILMWYICILVVRFFVVEGGKWICSKFSRWSKSNMEISRSIHKNWKNSIFLIFLIQRVRIITTKVLDVAVHLVY